MSSTIAAPVKNHGLVEKITLVFTGGAQAAKEVAQLLSTKAVPFSECFGSTGFVPSMGKAVLVFPKTEERWELGRKSPFCFFAVAFEAVFFKDRWDLLFKVNCFQGRRKHYEQEGGK